MPFLIAIVKMLKKKEMIRGSALDAVKRLFKRKKCVEVYKFRKDFDVFSIGDTFIQRIIGLRTLIGISLCMMYAVDVPDDL